MYKRTVKYTDYNGNERTEDFYFNLTKAELMEMQFTTEGGMREYLQKIIDSNDQKRIMEMFKDLVLKAYGEKSADGRRFIKNQEVREAFSQTEAYSIIFMDLSTSAEAATAFTNGIMPADISKGTAGPKLMAPTEAPTE